MRVASAADWLPITSSQGQIRDSCHTCLQNTMISLKGNKEAGPKPASEVAGLKVEHIQYSRWIRTRADWTTWPEWPHAGVESAYPWELFTMSEWQGWGVYIPTLEGDLEGAVVLPGNGGTLSIGIIWKRPMTGCRRNEFLSETKLGIEAFLFHISKRPPYFAWTSR